MGQPSRLIRPINSSSFDPTCPFDAKGFHTNNATNTPTTATDATISGAAPP